MVKKDYWKEPYEVIEAKLQLAELTIELGEVTREKWKRLLKSILKCSWHRKMIALAIWCQPNLSP